MLDSVIKAKKKCYPQTLLEDCKYEQERIKIENLIYLEKPHDDLEKRDSDSDSNDEAESDINNDNSDE